MDKFDKSVNLEYNLRYGVLYLNDGEVVNVAEISTSETGRKIKISKAINEKKRVRFNLFDYTVHKKRKFREGIYECSPYALTFSDERYYLISHCEKHPAALTHFRVDRMVNVCITDELIVEQSEELNVEE